MFLFQTTREQNNKAIVGLGIELVVLLSVLLFVLKTQINRFLFTLAKTFAIAINKYSIDSQTSRVINKS